MAAPNDGPDGPDDGPATPRADESAYDKPSAEADHETAKDVAAQADQPAQHPKAPDDASAQPQAAQPQGAQPGLAVPSTLTSLDIVDVREGMFGAPDSGDTSGFGGLSRPIAMPDASARPYGGWFDDVADRLIDAVPDDAVEHVVVDRGEITFHVAREHLVAVVQHLRDDPHLRFEFCSSVSGVHYPYESGRELHVLIHLLSMSYKRRIRVEVTAPDADPHIPSVVGVYPTADWHEREAWDMFGIVFDGHPALTRILMPDDWDGHPQRKDYPLGGIDVQYKGGTVPSPEHRRRYA